MYEQNYKLHSVILAGRLYDIGEKSSKKTDDFFKVFKAILPDVFNSSINICQHIKFMFRNMHFN